MFFWFAANQKEIGNLIQKLSTSLENSINEDNFWRENVIFI